MGGCGTSSDDDASGSGGTGFLLTTEDSNGSFSLSHLEYPSFSMKGFEPAIRVGNKTFRCADYGERHWETLEGKAGWRLSCKGASDAPDLFLVIEKTSSDRSLSLRAQTEGAVEDLRGFEVMAAEGGLSLGSGDAAFLSNGYQSWSPSGAIQVGSPPTGRLDGVLSTRGKEDENRDGRHVSWWFTAIQASQGPSLVMGATTANRFKSAIAVFKKDADKEAMTLRVLSGMTGERVSAKEAEIVSSERFLLMIGEDPWDLLREYAQEFSPSRSKSAVGARGWNSWYDLYGDVSAEDIEANAAVIAQELKGSERFTLVIDDGWQREWGDWEPNEKFPAGMASVANAIKDKGLVPGLWLAPLLADDESSLITEHPEWFVKDDKGAMLTYIHPNGPQSILDVTHPEAAAFIQEQVSNAVSWGYEMLKLDFLFVGAYEGVRHEDVTGTEAYEIALDVLRQAMGEEIFFLACGAPLFSAARPMQYDAIRTGADIAYKGIGPSWSFFATQLRQTAARSFLNGLAFEVDPDPPLVRATVEDTKFTADEAWSMVVSVLVSGGMFFASDDLSQLGEERLALLKHEVIDQIRSLPDPTAKPIDLLDDPELPGDRIVDALFDHVQMNASNPGGTSSVQPYAYRWDDGNSGAIAALFAFQPEGKSIDLPLEKLGLDPNASWTVSTLGPGPEASIDSGSLQVQLEGHQAVVLSVTGSL
jgi:hypothetical protein